MARTIKLRSSDGEVFDVEEAVAMESQTMKHVIEDDCADGGITLYNVTSDILVKVIEYCKKHVDAAVGSFIKALGGVDKDLESWDEMLHYILYFLLVTVLGYCSQVGVKPQLLESVYSIGIVITASNSLNIEGLQDLTTRVIADNIRGRSHKRSVRSSTLKMSSRPRMRNGFGRRTPGRSSDVILLHPRTGFWGSIPH
ncbi:hypothetical protein MUK42_27297, partial [Musa troglodytarum]